nr:Iron-sulfur cluster formation ABC transporter ATP-binding subunit [Meringosphaera mediterranea]
MQLKIQNLYVSKEKNEILKGLNLEVKKGQIHAIMGTNGSGKSTLSKVLAGHPIYKITEGTIFFKNQRINNLTPEERSFLGLFLAFQYPIEIPGVNNEEFLRLAYNLQQKEKKKKLVTPLKFFEEINQKSNEVGLSSEFIARNVNEGFSGGEKKRNEILQMNILNPELAILDETDSGLDVDALKQVATAICKFMTPQKSLILITHYQRLLDYINPDFVHIMHNGKIIKTGNAELAKTIEAEGYNWLIKE